MRGFITWPHAPLSVRSWLLLKFWLFAALSTVFVGAAVADVVRGIRVELGKNPPPLLSGGRLGIGIVVCLVIGGLFAWRAVRAYRRSRS